MPPAGLLKDVLQSRIGGLRTVLFDGFGEAVAEEREVGVVDDLELVPSVQNPCKQPATSHHQVEQQGKGKNVHLWRT